MHVMDHPAAATIIWCEQEENIEPAFYVVFLATIVKQTPAGGPFLLFALFRKFLLLLDPRRNVLLLPSLSYELVHECLSFPIEDICSHWPIFRKAIPPEVITIQLLERCPMGALFS